MKLAGDAAQEWCHQVVVLEHIVRPGPAKHRVVCCITRTKPVKQLASEWFAFTSHPSSTVQVLADYHFRP